MRELQPHWNGGLVAASIAISLLGTFTSTQLVCQARLSRHVAGTLLWTFLASLTFGFCSIWCLHFVAMLAYELDLPIGLNVSLTMLSAFLAVIFTFVALASDLVVERYFRYKRGSCKSQFLGRRLADYLESTKPQLQRSESEEPFLQSSRRQSEDQPPVSQSNHHFSPKLAPLHPPAEEYTSAPFPALAADAAPTFLRPNLSRRLTGEEDDDGGGTETDSEYSFLRRQSDTTSETSSFGLGLINSTKTWRQSATTRNPLSTMVIGLWYGISLKNIAKGFFWSLAITSMHYSGIVALKVPDGFCTFHPGLVLASALISWIVCTIACILMPQMETYLFQQTLFAIVATTGVAAMHFTGMAAVRFWSNNDPQHTRGYPTGLPVTIVCIATLTCISANGLLVHSATIARNKLTEIIKTRRKLWAALAQKEHAEASAQARSEFIASASHEIRTPLHQLQGYGDLLAREKLTAEGRMLLHAIQDATKTLSLITNNVLDWSRLEKGEAIHRPTFLDVRNVVDSVVGLLPNKSEDNQVEILVSVSPKVPNSLFMDELSLTRVILNLLSNACKFTTHGYILLSVETLEDKLVITVEDTGCGIPESFIPHLFEPFKQAETRGAERGTGLGLSIVKQLLAKICGTIVVNSYYREDPGHGSEKQGSSFTISIPMQEGPIVILDDVQDKQNTKVAVFDDVNIRLSEGLIKAWATYDCAAQIVRKGNPLSEFKYVWVSASILAQDQQLHDSLAQNTAQLVFVPYDDENTLYQVLRSRPSSHFLPVKRPLIWHKMMRVAEGARGQTLKADIGKPSVRFAEEVEIMPESPSKALKPLVPLEHDAFEQKKIPLKIMLVEDNKINVKLGIKMLNKCGYDVVVAEDGQEAIDLLIEQDEDIDIILMDQNMPRKDGLEATKEIRQLEATASLRGSRKFRGTPEGDRRIIIAVTAVVGPAYEALCKQAGTDAFLPKPLSLTKLKEVLAVYSDGTG